MERQALERGLAYRLRVAALPVRFLPSRAAMVIYAGPSCILQLENGRLNAILRCCFSRLCRRIQAGSKRQRGCYILGRHQRACATSSSLLLPSPQKHATRYAAAWYSLQWSIAHIYDNTHYVLVMQATGVLGTQLGSQQPHFTLLLGGERALTALGQNALLEVLALFLQHCRRSGVSSIGGRSLQHLKLDQVMQPDRPGILAGAMKLRKLFVW